MAQAARLNLRMQREVKLLLTDPPPGASFPSLSESNFTSIDANFQGPEGTVYANGVFKIKIQIPERYPFQPPILTFVTPIYHPNIDNGGRICLDILNLPPKGSWQPSLNISTVLTSIGLLLSEPNPDDGLMHEASRDYKYNRQAFEHNARSMTEKYATIRDSEGGSHDCPTHIGRSTRQAEGEGSDVSLDVADHQRGFSGSIRKLSLGSSSSSVSIGKGINDVSIHCHTEIGPLKEAKGVASNCEKKLQAPLYKQSVRVSTNPPKSFPSVKVDNHKQVIGLDEYRKDRSRSTSSRCEKQVLQSLKSGRRSIESDRIMDHVNQSALSQLDATTTHEALLCSVGTSHDGINPRKDATGMNDNRSSRIRLDRESSLGKIPALEPLVGLPQSHLEDEKENLIPVQHLLHKSTEDTSSPHSKFFRLTNDVRLDEKHEINENVDCKLERSNGEDDVIVLDSEDSGEENAPSRSKLLLARKRLLKKRKSNI